MVTYRIILENCPNFALLKGSNITTTFNVYKLQSSNNLNLNAMNALRNKVQLIGHVGQDPEIKTLEGGK